MNMASLKFEIDTDGVRQQQIEFIRDVLVKRGYTNNKVVIKAAGQAGDNYVAHVKRISVIGEDGRDLQMIAKIAPENDDLRKAMNIAVMFNNEALMYEHVLPKLSSLQKAAGVQGKDMFLFAECYGCLKEEPHEVILLEDLNESDYVMLDRRSYINDHTVRLILQRFTILHSLSYALKKIEPETYNNFKTKLVDIWGMICEKEEMMSIFAQTEDGALAVVDDKYKDYIRGKVTKIPEFTAEFKNADSDSNNLIIQQGDGWINNILFKLNNGAPSECIMIDYQVSRETSPVCDILYMIFNCTDHNTRKEHYHKWIDYYYEELDKSLQNFAMKASDNYPRENLDADLKRYSKIYFGTAIMLYGIITKKPEEAKVMQDAMKEFDKEKMDSQMTPEDLSDDTVLLLKSRIEDLVDSYQYLGYMWS